MYNGGKKGRYQVKKIHTKGNRLRTGIKKKAEAFSKLTPVKKVKKILKGAVIVLVLFLVLFVVVKIHKNQSQGEKTTVVVSSTLESIRSIGNFLPMNRSIVEWLMEKMGDIMCLMMQ